MYLRERPRLDEAASAEYIHVAAAASPRFTGGISRAANERMGLPSGVRRARIPQALEAVGRRVLGAAEPRHGGCGVRALSDDSFGSASAAPRTAQRRAKAAWVVLYLLRRIGCC